ncbi:hypothetical protein [Kordia periserrulae]|nr:hypothetical protein [Kordia periserrulae]
MNFRYIFLSLMAAICVISCADNNKKENNATTTEQSKNTENTAESVVLVQSFVDARNSYNKEKLAAMTPKNYQESFDNKVVEVKSQDDFLAQIGWAKVMDSKTTIEKVISKNDAAVVVIETNSNYINTALELKPRKFKTKYYLKDGKIVRQSFGYPPNEKIDVKANNVIYGNFERYCKVRNIPVSWEPTKEDGEILRKALEAYANREREPKQ